MQNSNQKPARLAFSQTTHLPAVMRSDELKILPCLIARSGSLEDMGIIALMRDVFEGLHEHCLGDVDQDKGA